MTARPLALVSLLLVLLVPPAHALRLITDDEARLPAAPEPAQTRAITRGPAIVQVSPDPKAATLRPPFNLKVAFEARGGARIDVASATATYLKSPAVDLLPRLQSGISARGIDLADVQVPPGEHKIRISLKDSEGRQGSAVVRFVVPE